jgi:hypothetical protein
MSKIKSTSKKTTIKTDLADSADDKKHLQPDEGTLDLPEVKDIPGQEKIRPLLKGELGDVTASSDDEEGKNILDTDEDDLDTELNSNVTKDERTLLRKSAESLGSEDDLSLENAVLDNTDEDGTPLNESDDQSGKDLDIPDDDENDDDMVDDDEENDSYSLSDDKEDDINTRQ